MRSDHDFDELHVVKEPVGHILSRQCWCEPSPLKMMWENRNKETGRPLLIVQHEDVSPSHHSVILAERERTQDWITRFLNKIHYFPDRPLPKNPDNPDTHTID